MISNIEHSAKIKIARIAAVSMSFVHVQGFIKKVSQDKLYDLTLIASKDHFWSQLEAKFPNVKKVDLKIFRDISIVEDLKSTFRLYQLMRSEKFDLVHSHTPKAGLITALAGFFARVPVRIHTFTGQRWATFTGPKRQFLKMLDRIIVLLNTHNLTDSHTQMNFLIEENITSAKKISVVHKGNFAGVDLTRFKANDPLIKEKSAQIVMDLGLQKDSFKLLFLGRITKDKGITELVHAFKQLQAENKKVELLLIGPREQEFDPLPEDTIKEIENNAGIKSVGFNNSPECFYDICDVFCLPSYREGFPNVILEANAMEKAVIGSNVYGISDSIEDQQTGLLCEVQNTHDLYLKINRLIEDKDLRDRLGKNGKLRVEKDFNHEVITEATLAEYQRILNYKRRR